MFTVIPVPMSKSNSEKMETLAKDANSAQDKVEELQGQLDRLHLITQSIWELIQSKTDLTDDDLLAKVQEVDLRDGRLDGKSGAKPQNCPKCRRVVSVRTNVCIYCGIKADKTSAF